MFVLRVCGPLVLCVPFHCPLPAQPTGRRLSNTSSIPMAVFRCCNGSVSLQQGQTQSRALSWDTVGPTVGRSARGQCEGQWRCKLLHSASSQSCV